MKDTFIKDHGTIYKTYCIYVEYRDNKIKIQYRTEIREKCFTNHLYVFGLPKRIDTKHGFKLYTIPYTEYKDRRINKVAEINHIMRHFEKWANNIIWRGRFNRLPFTTGCIYNNSNNYCSKFDFIPKSTKQASRYITAYGTYLNFKAALINALYDIYIYKLQLDDIVETEAIGR